MTRYILDFVIAVALLLAAYEYGRHVSRLGRPRDGVQILDPDLAADEKFVAALAALIEQAYAEKD